jgi:hypothetical protein
LRILTLAIVLSSKSLKAWANATFLKSADFDTYKGTQDQAMSVMGRRVSDVSGSVNSVNERVDQTGQRLTSEVGTLNQRIDLLEFTSRNNSTALFLTNEGEPMLDIVAAIQKAAIQTDVVLKDGYYGMQYGNEQNIDIQIDAPANPIDGVSRFNVSNGDTFYFKWKQNTNTVTGLRKMNFTDNEAIATVTAALDEVTSLVVPDVRAILEATYDTELRAYINFDELISE